MLGEAQVSLLVASMIYVISLSAPSLPASRHSPSWVYCPERRLHVATRDACNKRNKNGAHASMHPQTRIKTALRLTELGDNDGAQRATIAKILGVCITRFDTTIRELKKQTRFSSFLLKLWINSCRHQWACYGGPHEYHFRQHVLP